MTLGLQERGKFQSRDSGGKCGAEKSSNARCLIMMSLIFEECVVSRDAPLFLAALQ